MRIMIVLIMGLMGAPCKGQTDPLDGLVAQLLARNLDIRAMRSQLGAAQEQIKVADGWANPMVTYNAFGKPIETRMGAQRANVMVSQSLPWPGKISSRENAARAQAEGAVYALEAMKLQKIHELETHYYQLYVLEKKKSLYEENLTWMRSLHQIALAKVKVGGGNQVDVTEAAVELSELQEQLTRITAQSRARKSQINALLDRGFSAAVEVHSRLDIEPAMVGRALDKNPTILHAKTQIKSAEAQLRHARLQLAPDLKASFSYFFIDEQTAMQPSSLDEDAWAVGASVTIPLFWGKASGAKAKAIHTKTAAEHKAAGLHRKLSNELQELQLQIKDSQSILKLFESSVLTQAEQIVRLQQENYQKGVVTFDRVVMDTRKMLRYNVRNHQERARLATLISKHRLLTGQYPKGTKQ